MSRKSVIAGNWKMYKTCGEVVSTIESLRRQVDGYDRVEIVICPPFTTLAAASRALKGSTVSLGAQNMHWETEGAFTGEVSSKMLVDCGCSFVILGHSERRQHFRESDEEISRKLEKALSESLTPILCVGETLEEREAGRVAEVVLGQLSRGLGHLTEDKVSRIIIAYEPVWAIGTGRTATPEVAEKVHGMIRNWLAETYSPQLSGALRVLYGGSVKPGNIAELMAQPDIDGALVGGASLDPLSFSQIIKY